MSMISEQIKELREIVSSSNPELYVPKKIRNMILQAADTIEVLSTTLNKDEDRCRCKYAEVYHIGETVNKLHELCGEKIGWIHYGREIADSFQMINRLCGFIESLSTKLRAENMERSVEDFNEWIYCGDGKNFPEGENVKVIASAVWDGYEYTTESYFYHGEFYNKPYYQISAGEICESYTGDKVVAWKPFPDPYHEP